MRTFALVNGLGERVDLMSVEHFYYAPENLGFKRDITTRKVGNRWVLVNRTNAQLNPTGTVMFMGANPYADYFNFVQFCSVSPMILEYTPYDDTYKMRVEVSELEKSEINRNGILQCNIEFTPLTMYYKEISSIYMPSSAEASGWIWPVTWGITWTNSNDMTLVLNSESYEESPCKLTMYGPLVNPIWRHYVNGELIEQGILNTTIAGGNILEVDNSSDPYSIKVYNAIGELVQNAYQLADFSTERFINIRRGRNLIRVSDDGMNNVRLKAEAKIYYESV